MSSDTLVVDFFGDETIVIPSDVNKNIIKNILIKEGFTILNGNQFYGFPVLNNIKSPNSLVTINDNGFSLSYLLKYLLLPKNVKNIATTNPFDYGLIEYIDVDPENPYFSSVDGVLFSKDMKILYEFPICKNVTSYLIPNTVSRVAFGAFNRARYLKKIYIPDSVVDLSAQFCFDNHDTLKEVIVYRYYKQKVPYIGSQSFMHTTFQESNITYIYSINVMKTCTSCFSSFLKSVLLCLWISE